MGTTLRRVVVKESPLKARHSSTLSGQQWVRLGFSKDDVADNVMGCVDAGGGEGVFRIWAPPALVPEEIIGLKEGVKRKRRGAEEEEEAKARSQSGKQSLI
jgi:hypothetical protein